MFRIFKHMRKEDCINVWKANPAILAASFNIWHHFAAPVERKANVLILIRLRLGQCRAMALPLTMPSTVVVVVVVGRLVHSPLSSVSACHCHQGAAQGSNYTQTHTHTHAETQTLARCIVISGRVAGTLSGNSCLCSCLPSTLGEGGRGRVCLREAVRGWTWKNV